MIDISVDVNSGMLPTAQRSARLKRGIPQLKVVRKAKIQLDNLDR